MKGKKADADKALLETLQDFTSKENWDEFFKLRSDNPFEWYGDWSTLEEPLAKHCGLVPKGNDTSLDILVPGCGNSELSEKLYDAGFTRITNIDFSKVVIQSMLRKHLRSRPQMLWRVMDMTQMQFPDNVFDVVIDKGSLDALMEPELGPKLGIQFLAEVKRVLRQGGKYICISLAQTHVIELLLCKFRFGWKVSVHVIPPKMGSSVSSYHPFLITAVKDGLSNLYSVTTALDSASSIYNKSQVKGLLDTVSRENNFRSQHSAGDDILYSLEELQIGAKGDLKQLAPGRRVRVILGGPGISNFSFKAVIMDLCALIESFSYSCGAFLVPESRAHEWLFSSEEGQWQIAESAKARRLIMVFLDSSHAGIDMSILQKDLSPLIQSLAPAYAIGSQIPFMMARDDVAERAIVQEVHSPSTGKIIVEDVILTNDKSNNIGGSDGNMMLRRLVFERNHSLVQSEAILRSTSLTKGKQHNVKDSLSSSRQQKQNNRRGRFSGYRKELLVDHTYLSSLYHSGMIVGLQLVISQLEHCAYSKKMAKTLIIGLGAGLLPMFLHKAMPFLQIEVVELDAVVANMARAHFGFTEDTEMKLRIGDGVKIIEEYSGAVAPVNNSLKANGETMAVSTSSCLDQERHEKETQGNKKPLMLIIDADSDDTSTGLTCPHRNFLEESFLRAAKETLEEGGIFILNLVSRSATIHEMVISRMQTVFETLFSLEIEEDVNKVLFGLSGKLKFNRQEAIPEAACRLEKLLESSNIWDKNPKIKEYTGKIKHLTS
eukprot:TRINITY_DN31086_c0_g1_i1.p1 TRINITY_DN31086_c0_g1~~TRINITY_DN31086_c0_g1_i1.p1  ORF type:complete len:773 (-),score=145.30 TRINITY_DN31086_c0_g1_i1:38-2356(-)